MNEKPATLSPQESLVVAAFLLQSFEDRKAKRIQHVLCGGESAFEAVQHDLAGLIARLHPELARCNIPSQYLVGLESV